MFSLYFVSSTSGLDLSSKLQPGTSNNTFAKLSHLKNLLKSKLPTLFHVHIKVESPSRLCIAVNGTIPFPKSETGKHLSPKENQ